MENVATKEHRKLARGLIEGLEIRVHSGPPVLESEIHSARDFLRENEFSPESDYFSRLYQVQTRLATRPPQTQAGPARRKGNYGGEAGGRWMQLQSAYDHVILSTCYDGVFNLKPGRIKISHRFNQQGRLDFVELKFLRSLQPCLNGELRKLILIKDYQDLRKDWSAAEAHVLEVLPRELVFLFEDIFRCPKHEVLGWLANIGHRLADDLIKGLRSNSTNGHGSQDGRNPDQLSLRAILTDEVAPPILEKAAALHCVAECQDPKTVLLRCVRHSAATH